MLTCVRLQYPHGSHRKPSQFSSAERKFCFNDLKSNLPVFNILSGLMTIHNADFLYIKHHLFWDLHW